MPDDYDVCDECGEYLDECSCDGSLYRHEMNPEDSYDGPMTMYDVNPGWDY